MAKICIVVGCEKKHRSKGYCASHYTAVKRHGTPNPPKKEKIEKTCIVEGCNKVSKCKNYCNTHYANYRRTGDPIPQIKPHTHEECIVEGCGKKHRRNGFCNTHSSRVRRHNDPNISKNPNTHRGHEGCIKDDCNNKHFAKGLCKKHHYKDYITTPEGRANTKKARRKYSQTLKGKIVNRLKRQRRRHLEKDHVKLTLEEVLYIYKIFKHKCFNCDSPDDLTLDHHVPLIKGGILELSNTVLLCRSCNGLKADISPQKFYSKYKLSKLHEIKES